MPFPIEESVCREFKRPWGYPVQPHVEILLLRVSILFRVLLLVIDVEVESFLVVIPNPVGLHLFFGEVHDELAEDLGVNVVGLATLVP